MTELEKHTPAPWDTDGLVVWGADKEEVCDLTENFLPCGVNNANAQLIAAAPDLLGALKALKERGHTEATWNLCLKAIVKATGGNTQ